MSVVKEQTEGVQFLKRVVEGKLTTPLLLVGNEGTGRRFAVTQAAKESWPGEVHELQIDRGVHPDLILIQPASGREIGVDAIREVVTQAFTFPSMVPSRFVVIDGADTMTPAAANALLKTLEEPPRTTRFFLLAQSADRVIPTIRSRCGIVRFGPLSEALIVEHLKLIEPDAAKALVLARLSGGSIGLATQFKLTGRLRLRDQMLGLLKAGLRRDLSSLFSAVDAIPDLRLGLHFLEHLLGDLVMLPHAPTRLANLDLTEELVALRAHLAPHLDKLIEGLRLVQDRFRQATTINEDFHVKSYLATAFSE